MTPPPFKFQVSIFSNLASTKINWDHLLSSSNLCRSNSSNLWFLVQVSFREDLNWQKMSQNWILFQIVELCPKTMDEYSFYCNSQNIWSLSLDLKPCPLCCEAGSQVLVGLRPGFLRASPEKKSTKNNLFCTSLYLSNVTCLSRLAPSKREAPLQPKILASAIFALARVQQTSDQHHLSLSKIIHNSRLAIRPQ